MDAQGTFKAKSVSKRAYMKRKPRPEEGHWEGKYWCNCRTRNIRKWLSKKKYGHEEEASEGEQDFNRDDTI